MTEHCYIRIWEWTNFDMTVRNMALAGWDFLGRTKLLCDPTSTYLDFGREG